MGAAEIKAQEKRINELAVFWKTADPQKDAAAKEDARLQLIELLYLGVLERFIGSRTHRRETAMGYNDNLYEDMLRSKGLEVIIYCMDAFDPSEGNPFMNFFSKTAAFRLDGVGAEYYTKSQMEAVSLDDTVGSDDDSAPVIDLVSFVGDQCGDETLGKVLDVMAAATTALLPGENAGGARRRWFPLFLTEYVTMLSQAFQFTDCDHPRDLFTAMELPYQDYYSAGKYRSIQEIARGQLKPMGEINPFCRPEEQNDVIVFGGDGEAGREIFPASVCMCYLGKWTCAEDANKKKGTTLRSEYLRQFRQHLESFGLRDLI